MSATFQHCTGAIQSRVLTDVICIEIEILYRFSVFSVRPNEGDQHLIFLLLRCALP